MTCFEKWNIFTNLLIAIGTIGVVIVAIFANKIKDFLFRAKLSVKILDTKGELTILNNGEKVLYYHLRIVNEKPSIKIENCRVFLKKIKKKKMLNSVIYH